MKKKNEQMDILAIGIDTFSMERIKSCLQENKITHEVTFLKEVAELAGLKKRVFHAVFLYSNRLSQKTVEDIRYIHQNVPAAGITLMSPRSDLQGIVTAFRAGLFDFLSLPLDEHELRTVIYRLKLHGAIQGGQWNPERAVLHLFSRPESFSTVQDVASSLDQYLNIFFDIEKEINYSSNLNLIFSLKEIFKFGNEKFEKIKLFLSDDTGLIFGLKLSGERFHFLVKRGDGNISYLVVRNSSQYSLKDILSDYLANVLRTSLTILQDSKKREEIRMLALTDEVTGIFNQRKLLEDLDLYIGRFEHDKVGFSLLFVDIDYFKNVNDQFGHVVGSQLLIDMSNILKAQLRSSDLVYRYGGDEFIVLLPRTTLAETKKIALRISEAVKACEFEVDKDKKYRLSLSIGLAEFPTDATSAKSVIDFADKMMYMSKKSGRGKVFHVTEVVA